MLEDGNDADAVSVNDMSHLPPLVTESEDAFKDVTLREPRRQNGLKAQNLSRLADVYTTALEKR
jgi:hypothetical protein